MLSENSRQTKSIDDVEHARREPSLDKQLGNIQGRKRGLFTGLDDNRVPSHEGRHGLIDDGESRAVPGDDSRGDAERLAERVRELPWSRSGVVDRLSGELVCPAGGLFDIFDVASSAFFNFE
jgi:hypothetical protein